MREGVQRSKRDGGQEMVESDLVTDLVTTEGYSVVVKGWSNKQRLTPWTRALIQKLRVSQRFMEPECSLPCS
jgi:hypothetical protein